MKRTFSMDAIKKIKNLRRTGHSIPEINRELVISKSSISRYIRGVAIHRKYYHRWLARRNASKIISERSWELAARRAHELMQNSRVSNLALSGAMLYWGEGSKKDFSFSNTDPEMVRFFLFTLRNAFGVKNSDIKISIRTYEDLDKATCLKYWSKVTSIHLGAKTSVNVLYGSKKGKLQYGMCRIRVKKGGFLLKQVFSIIQHIAALASPRSSMDRASHS